MNNERPQIIISPTKLQSVATSSNIILEGIRVLHNNIKKEEFTDCALIGIAQNIMLGIFKVYYVENEGYYCSRIMTNNGNIITGDAKFPITNMEHSESTIDCNIDYLVCKDTIAMVEI